MVIFVDNEIEGDIVVEDVDFQPFGCQTRIIDRDEDTMEEDDDSNY